MDMNVVSESIGLRAAAYLRMSTELQDYSIRNQYDLIKEYAAAKSIEVVKTYEDHAKSGLTFAERGGLKMLIRDVQEGDADFDVVLVYDVSRWGRFQDVDESAFYEYICRRAGIAVIYCAEPFQNDGSPLASIMKSIKRSMAAEFSRELSKKVFAGQSRLVGQGYMVGGKAPYGLRRLLVDASGAVLKELSPGQRKLFQSDRIVLIPGPPDELNAVRLIFKLYVEEGKRPQAIANELNRAGTLRAGVPWSYESIGCTLRNEKYAGAIVWNKSSFKLSQARIANPPELWIRAEGAVQAVVDPVTFDAAQKLLCTRHRGHDRREMLAALRRLYEKHGYVTEALMKATRHKPTAVTYRTHFGKLQTAYELIGFAPKRLYRVMGLRKRSLEIRADVLTSIVSALRELGIEIAKTEHTGIWRLNAEFTFSVTTLPFIQRTDTYSFWTLRRADLTPADINILVRLNKSNSAAEDFYFLPRSEMEALPNRLKRANGHRLDAFRSPDYSPILDMVKRTDLKTLT